MISQTSPLVVGVDGSERSRDALALATRLADPGQQILLTHVHDYGRISNLLSGRGYEQLVRDVADSTFTAVQETLEPTTQRELRLVSSNSPAAGLQATADLHEQLTEAIAGLGDGSDAGRRVVDGDAAVELAEASAELDLLVLGSRGYGPVRSVLLGSVSRSLVHAAACPVVVLPRGVHGAGEEGEGKRSRPGDAK